MSASYSTLSPLDRVLATVPRNPWSATVERVGEGNLRETVVRVANFQGDRVLRAVPVSDTCCEVRVENYPHVNGRRDRLGRVVEFTTSPDFVMQWVSVALSVG
jgi:hypothetical protein